MSTTTTKKKYEVKYENILESNNKLSLTDILWLDNLAYFRDMHINTKNESYVDDYLIYISENGNTIDGKVFDRMKEQEASAGYAPGLPIGWTEDEMNEVYSNLISNENITGLKIVNIISLDGLTAACYKDSDDNVYVIYRGTDGPEAWVDNLQAMNMVSSPLQERAHAFYQESMEMAGNVNQIVVSGHSKGGNLAKYISLLEDDVDACIAFDGQGFSNKFFDTYADKIKKNKGKIIEINAEYDFVHCLGNVG